MPPPLLPISLTRRAINRASNSPATVRSALPGNPSPTRPSHAAVNWLNVRATSPKLGRKTSLKPDPSREKPNCATEMLPASTEASA
eukprot:1213814-Rhodomonas_salina.1